MVFSFFGRKPAKPPARGGRAAGAKPKAPAPAQKAPPSSPPEEEGEDLDFTNWPAGGIETTATPAPGAPPDTSPAADAPGIAVPIPSWLADAPSSGPEAPPPATKADDARARTARGMDSRLSIEVESGSKDVPGAIEESAILFANGQTREALVRLADALAADELGDWTQQGWLMRFDLFQHLGMRAEFEEKALEFVVEFERSPPIWSEAPPPAPLASPMRTGGSSHVPLAGALSGASAGAIEQLRKLAEKQGRARLDLARVSAADGEGARLLHAALFDLRKAGKDVYFTGHAQLLAVLAAQAPSGERNADPALWLLALEVCQQIGEQQRYEDLALEYAITYEVSPPAWENGPAAKPMPGDLDVGAGGAADGAFVIEGDVAGSSEKMLAELDHYAASANPVVIDMRRARRVDFVNAGQLLNALSRIEHGGKSIEIRGANEMIAALLGMMGVREFARLVARK